MKELQKKDKDKVEQVKQQVQEIQTVFDSRIRPQKNHTLFEINIIEKTIENAKYTFAHCEKMYNMPLADKFTLFNVPFEMVERLTGNGKELVARMKQVQYGKYMQTPNEYWEYQKQNDKWYTVKSLGLENFVATTGLIFPLIYHFE